MGQKLVFVPECHSTNTLAAELAQKTKAPEGTLVITNHQTAGRGQRGNRWEAESGKNLTLSFILYPSFLEAADQFELNKAVALAVADCLQLLGMTDVKIKWPNDVMIGKRKVCGILIENSLSQTKINQSIIGIGLNVNQTSFGIDTPTSLALVTGKVFDLHDVLNALVKALEMRYLQLRSGMHLPLNEDYHQLLYWKDEIHHFASKDEQFEGRIMGVDNSGKLQVEINQTLKGFNLKEIQFVQ